MDNSLTNTIDRLPHSPGVYIFKDEKGVVIYVGKAKSLRSRVGSYFHSGIQPGTKTASLVSRISSIEHINVESELEALVLESELIKKHRPRYNIIQKDDKSYIYIVIRNSLGYDNVFTARQTDLKTKDKIFGPYPDSRIAKDIVRRLRQVFPFKDCSDDKFARYRKFNKPCLYGHLNLCPAPCLDAENTAESYSVNINKIKNVLSGKSRKITKSLTRMMNRKAKEQSFEEAIKYREVLKKYLYISNKIRDPLAYMENPYLVEDTALKSLEDIKDMLPGLNELSRRIECYDISNISGKEAVGSMVVSIAGMLDKREYKRFKIKKKESPDDYAMLSEVLFRRLRHSYGVSRGREKWDKPDLIVLDGGKGQLSVINTLLKEMGVEVAVIGLEKKFETIVFSESERLYEMRYDISRPGMKHIILLRNEAHRFAQNYHHLLRSKKLMLTG